MKIPGKTKQITLDLLEYKLDYTPNLRCEKQTDLVPVCKTCKSCTLSWKIFATQEWFMRASSATQRQFLAGLIKRFKNQDLLKYTWNFLKSTYSKDFIYSRSSIASSFQTSSTSNRALNLQILKQSMSDLWKWFLNATFWTKANYMLCLLKMCNSELLLMAASLISFLLAKDVHFTKTLAIGDGKAREEEPYLREQQKNGSHILSFLSSESAGSSSAFGSFLSSETTSLFVSPPHVKRVWSSNSDESSGEIPDSEDEISHWLVSLDVSKWPPSSQKVVICIDFIRCLPIQLSKRILKMLDPRSLTECSFVSPHWSFLVKDIRKDITAHRALQSEIIFFQAMCPKGAIPNYAKVVKVAIPQINKEGEIIPTVGRKERLQSQEAEYLQKAYHDQLMDNVVMEERNVFCSSYSVRVLIEREALGRMIDYSGGKLMAFGSVDRRIHFLDVNEVKEVPPVLFGHAGKIHAIYFNEQKGLLLSGGFDLTIRMWNINTGTVVKIFNGHTGTIVCLDLHKNKFVSGSKDCTAKMWDIVTGRCIKTFKHKGVVWAVKMNGIHVVSSCDKGLVKVWHVKTGLLIKALEGHLGPVRCLSFDKWHLVTGSNDGYVLGWSMVGKHKRCLMAFRHPMEVLYLGFLYLRVISGCADGKIRIFNFLTGACLRIMRANNRGDPVVSFCAVENRLLINALGSVVLFQFEKVEWDYTLRSDRVIKKKNKVADAQLAIRSSPHLITEWRKKAKKKKWKLYNAEETVFSYSITRKPTGVSGIPDLCYEMVKVPKFRTKHIESQDISQTERKRLSCFAKTEKLKKDLKDSESVSTLKGSFGRKLWLYGCGLGTVEPDVSPAAVTGIFKDDEPGHETEIPPDYVFAHNSDALLKYLKKRSACGPIVKDQALLTISTIHHACKADNVTANMAYNMKIKDAWGPSQLQKEQSTKTLAPKSPKPQVKDPSTQLKQLKTAGGILGFNKISTPYETKTLQLNLKNSLLGDNVQSFIPAPSVTHSKSCSSLAIEAKTPFGHARIPSPPGGQPLTGFFTSSSESLKVPRMKIAQPDIEAVLHRKKSVEAYKPNPYRLNTGFRLLTPQQMTVYEEATVLEYRANQTKFIANRQKECKVAWLRKIKGLPINDFTKEGKIAAPELGQNVFI